jgi:hypothetical protein
MQSVTDWRWLPKIATIEKRGVLIDGTETKPADVSIPLFWNYGRAIGIDICGAASVDFSINVEEPLSNAVNRKNSKFLVSCNESGVIFKSLFLVA